MGAAFALAADVLDAEVLETERLNRLLRERLAGIAGLCINGSPTQRIAHTLSFTFGNNDLDLPALGKTLAFSSTSACNSAKNVPSHVLLALGLSPQAASQTIRLSLGRFTREQDIERAAESIRACLIQPAFWAVAQSR
ncbi:hypothetical protein TOC8172_25880 [Pseudomonas syringae]